MTVYVVVLREFEEQDEVEFGPGDGITIVGVYESRTKAKKVAKSEFEFLMYQVDGGFEFDEETYWNKELQSYIFDEFEISIKEAEFRRENP